MSVKFPSGQRRRRPGGSYGYSSDAIYRGRCALWVVLLICGGVFLGSFMDAIAGGGGIITVPTYLMGLSDFPIYNALGTNKLSSSIGTVFSTVRFIRQGYVDWVLFAPAIVLALGGSVCGTWLQHHTPAVVLKYLLLLVLPVVAFITLRTRKWAGRAGAAGPKAPPPHCLGRRLCHRRV